MLLKICNEVVFNYEERASLLFGTAYICRHPAGIEHPHTEGIRSYMVRFPNPPKDGMRLRAFGGCWYVDEGDLD